MDTETFPRDEVDQDSKRGAPAFGGADAPQGSDSRSRPPSGRGAGHSAPPASSADIELQSLSFRPKVIDELILGWGELAARLLHVSPPEDPATRRGLYVSLGEAFFYDVMERLQDQRLSGHPYRQGQLVRELRREYLRIIGEPPTISQEIHRKIYDRARYQRRKASQLTVQERDWSRELRDALMGEIYEQHSRVFPDPQEKLEADWSEAVLREKLLPLLPPAEQRGLMSLLSGEPPADAADRQRRSRARRTIKELLLPFLTEGEESMDTDTPTMIERLTDLEQRVTEHDRQLGLPEGGPKAVKAAVQKFLTSLEEREETRA